MIRIVIENILLFLLPTIIYVAYITLTRRTRSPAGAPQDATKVLDEAPLIWLFIAGALLVIITLVAFGSTTGGKPGQSYQPPVLKDGRIEPGRVR